MNYLEKLERQLAEKRAALHELKDDLDNATNAGIYRGLLEQYNDLRQQVIKLQKEINSLRSYE